MGTLRQSSGASIDTGVSNPTLRRIVENGDGTLTIGNVDFSDVTLIAAADAAYLAASSGSPVLIGVGHLLFLPHRFPET